MRDGDDDEQVESHGEQRDGGQQRVEESGLRAGPQQPPAGGVQAGEAERGGPSVFHQGGGEAGMR